LVVKNAFSPKPSVIWDCSSASPAKRLEILSVFRDLWMLTHPTRPDSTKDFE
jgi:hypothetical protein